MKAQDIVIRPIITEKSMTGVANKKYRYEGYTRAWKKAVVTLTEGSKSIEFFESMV